MLPEADYEGVRDDIRQLIEIVSHERILTNKKELQIRLFDVLEELEIDEMCNGAINSKGYFQIRLYSKMYKIQLGNRWKTYFYYFLKESEFRYNCRIQWKDIYKEVLKLLRQYNP